MEKNEKRKEKDCTILWQRGMSNIDLLHVWERGGCPMTKPVESPQKGRMRVLLTLPHETSVLISGDARTKAFERKGEESSSSECICMWLYLSYIFVKNKPNQRE